MEIQFSQRHLELKINYLEDKLSKMPHGFFTNIKGRCAAVITYDPSDESVTNKHRRRHFTSSAKGKIYAQAVSDYISTKDELEHFRKIWKATYTRPPRKISFPLKKRRPDPISYEFFKCSEPNQNTRKNKHPIEHNNQIFRSKNEVIGCMVLEELGYEYKTEIKVDLTEMVDVYPDLSFYVPEIEKVFAKEIDGAMESVNYDGHSGTRTGAYVSAGFIEGKDLITVRIADSHDVDVEHIARQILSAIESSIDDIIFE